MSNMGILLLQIADQNLGERLFLHSKGMRQRFNMFQVDNTPFNENGNELPLERKGGFIFKTLFLDTIIEKLTILRLLNICRTSCTHRG